MGPCRLPRTALILFRSLLGLSLSPADAGETVALYASGLGALANSVAEYDWPTSANPTSVPVQADVAGVQATVLYAGAAPGYPGVYQINIVIPPGAATSAGANVRIF